MLLNAYGRVVEEEWLRTGRLRSEVELDVYVVMPNHVHGLVTVNETVDRNSTGRATQRVAPTRSSFPKGPVGGSVGAIIGQFKSAMTKRIDTLRGSSVIPIWQRNYYDHVVRDENELARVREYIANNPAKWALDEYNFDLQIPERP